MHHDLPSLHALRAFDMAARLQSVSRAGAELHVTHGAVSRQIRALETELGVALFVREGRGLTLTPAGRRLHEGVRDAFDQLRRAWHQQRNEVALAPITLGCSSSVLARWIIPRLERLQRELPDLTLHLAALEGMPPPALTGLDAALLLSQPPWPTAWQVQELASERIGPVASPEYARQARLAANDDSSLLRQPLLHTISRPQAWPDWADARHLAAEDLVCGQGFEHLYYLLEAAVAGLGMAIAPQPLVADDLSAGRLLAPWGFVTTNARWVLCQPRHADPRRLAPLITWLRQELAD